MQIKSRDSECRRNEPNSDWTRTYSGTIAASIPITMIPKTIYRIFYPHADLSKMAGPIKFMWGDLVANRMDFLIIAFIVFFAYKQGD
jgi:large-conductance mechanosensitive channel